MEEQNLQTQTSQDSGSKKTLMGVLAAALVIIIVSAVLLLNQKSKPKVSGPTTQYPATPGVTEMVAEDLTQKPVSGNVTVEASDYSFTPSTLTFKKGERIELTFKNNGSNPHNLVVEELGVNTQTISSGQTETLIFTALKSGEFTFYCAVGNHRDLGMEGKLIVEE